MYYKIYGVMSKTGFHTELFQENTPGKAKLRLMDIDKDLYPFFAITEHLQSGSPAVSIQVGHTKDRLPISVSALVDYRPNPMMNAELAEKLFTRLDQGAKPQTSVPTLCGMCGKDHQGACKL